MREITDQELPKRPDGMIDTDALLATVPTVNVKMAANSTKHGRYAKKMVLMTPKIHRRKRQIIDLLEGHKFPFGEIDMIAVELLARNLAKIDMVDTYLAEHGLWDEKGVPRATIMPAP